MALSDTLGNVQTPCLLPSRLQVSQSPQPTEWESVAKNPSRGRRALAVCPRSMPLFSMSGPVHILMYAQSIGGVESTTPGETSSNPPLRLKKYPSC